MRDRETVSEDCVGYSGDCRVQWELRGIQWGL